MTNLSIMTRSLALLFLLFAPFSSSASKVVEVNVLCAQTRDPSYCSKILNSRPGGAQGADLVTLAQYTIGVARANTTETLNLINTLIGQSQSDPKAKAHYSKCLTRFNKNEGALKDIDSLQHVLNNGDYYGAFKAATAVMVDIEDCITGDDYIDNSNLPQNADKVERVVDIILTITKYLIQK